MLWPCYVFCLQIQIIFCVIGFTLEIHKIMSMEGKHHDPKRREEGRHHHLNGGGGSTTYMEGMCSKVFLKDV